MPFEHLLTEKRERLGIITLNRPERMNALNAEVMQELWQALSLFEADREVAVLCLTGAGARAFCAGMEAGSLTGTKPLAALRLAKQGQSLVNRLEGLSKPTLAAVNGLALGAGFELVLACDLTAAVPGASFGFPEVRLGMIPAWGGTRRLAEVTGRRKVKELVYLSELLAAEQALELGIINAVVPADELMDKVADWAEKMMAGGRLALWQAKKVLDREGGMSLERAQDFEAECFAVCFTTSEMSERVKAYADRRAAAPSPGERDAGQGGEGEDGAPEEAAGERSSTDDFFE